MKSPLTELEDQAQFIRRHIGADEQQISEMLRTLGLESLDALIESTLPPSIQLEEPLALAESKDEFTTLADLRKIADLNVLKHSMIGMGYHDTITPTVILRNILENPGWYTAYTPYQAEISQGRLEAMLNFQQMICDLTSMELANASLLDEATAAAEAMAMLKRINRKNRSMRFFVDQGTLPQTQDVVRTRAGHFGFEIVVGDPLDELGKGDFFGALLQYTAADGEISHIAPLIETAQDNGALVAVATDLLSLVLLKPPGEMGADVVVGSAQRFGVPMGFGGPHAAFFATRDAFKRSVPGRIIGVSRDRQGQPAMRMALQTREQHIRRDNATSNICTAQALLAVMASMYAVYHGATGLKRIAKRIHRLTSLLVNGLEPLGYKPANRHWFDTVTFAMPDAQAELICKRAQDADINLYKGNGGLSISINEKTSRKHIAALLAVFADTTEVQDVAALDQSADAGLPGIPEGLQRSSGFLQHPVFNRYHSETEMLRYVKRLENKDLSLAHAMISLGSCTMKLNATSEMVPVTWPEFADIHPFAPAEQTRGYHHLFEELEDMLIACTGYDAVSLQPNAGSQGEYAGLLAIKGWHESRNEAHRNICLIPSSAHGTNPASAAMAGMKIVIVKCDDNGNVDVEDLREKAEKHASNLSALMITYPSTHGVFEQQIGEICDITHQYGGQVYLDGANLNALVGCAAPGRFGADVSHLNLHKTFCIPHGGGGPGVGPICTGSHLAPFLSGHSVVKIPGAHGSNGAVAAAPWGSAGILPITWAYITMMGRDGMKKATQVAILNANYIAHRLSNAFPILYTGRNGRIAHECIIDLRPFKQSSGISEEDVAKRLIDYGFHAPTMSFPVPGTLMIEPTESESLYEIDRFCDAMLAIREEISALESGEADKDDNPLSNSPHTQRDLVGEWQHPYSREVAAFPAAEQWQGKFWPAVNRVDNVFGDRNLFCSCPLPGEWQQEED
ncbi:MAG: aminomethyl-transferring glycine dehydrogenase [Gammaproteobacteria bacterium]|nr:aminomethyl-transferring glycine dehydrogenase [Gammaproteobacteria bacterium]